MTPNQSIPQEAPPTAGQTGSNPMAIIGLVVAILGLIGFWVPFVGLVLAVAGLVLSIVGMKTAGQRAGAGKGVAIGGLVVSLLALPLGAMTSVCATACAGMAKSTVNLKQGLDEKAKAAGYESFEAWQKADPAKATAAAEAAGNDFARSWGINIDEDKNDEGAAATGEGSDEGSDEGAGAQEDGTE